MSIAVETRVLNKTCKFCDNGTCQLGLQIGASCPLACLSYEPNSRARLKAGFINWKYSIAWTSAAITIMSILEVIRL